MNEAAQEGGLPVAEHQEQLQGPTQEGTSVNNISPESEVSPFPEPQGPRLGESAVTQVERPFAEEATDRLEVRVDETPRSVEQQEPANQNSIPLESHEPTSVLNTATPTPQQTFGNDLAKEAMGFTFERGERQNQVSRTTQGFLEKLAGPGGG